MAKAGIAIDSWKLSIFERHLNEGGYAFEQRPGLVPSGGTITLLVETSNLHALYMVIREANNEAARVKGAH
jgi:hypothetical protein